VFWPAIAPDSGPPRSRNTAAQAKPVAARASRFKPVPSGVPASATVVDLSGQLPARGVDFVPRVLRVVTTSPARAEHLAEAFDRSRGGTHKPRIRERIERNQVDLASAPANQLYELARVLLGVVSPFEP